MVASQILPNFQNVPEKIRREGGSWNQSLLRLEAAKRELETPDVEVEEGDEDLTRRVVEESYYNKINEKAYEHGVKIYEALKKHAEDVHLMKRISGNMVLNCAFLVQKERIQDFKAKLEKLEKGYSDKGLKIQFSGPWPLYNFVSIHINT